MVLESMDESNSIKLFKKALEEEYEKRLEALRKEYEEILTELAAQYRQKTEVEINQIRKMLQAKYERTLRMEKDNVKGELMALIYKEINDVYERIISSLEEHLRRLASNDQEEYSVLLGRLVKEALIVLGEPAVVVVRPEDKDLLLNHPLIAEVEVDQEDQTLVFGGCKVLDANTRKKIVDNTIYIRAKKLKGEIRKRLSAKYKEVFDVAEKI